MLFRTPVTVVLNAAERKPTQQHADVDSAARALTYEYGIRVIVDASHNSLPDAAIATKREEVLEVEPMSRDVLESLPELKGLLEALRTADMADVTWGCVGGNPADYNGLLRRWRDGREDIGRVSRKFAEDRLSKAMSNKVEAVAANPRIKELFARFKVCAEVPFSVLEDMQLLRQSPDKVLRAVQAAVDCCRTPRLRRAHPYSRRCRDSPRVALWTRSLGRHQHRRSRPWWRAKRTAVPRAHGQTADDAADGC